MGKIDRGQKSNFQISVRREVEGSFTSIFLWGKSTGAKKAINFQISVRREVEGSFTSIFGENRPGGQKSNFQNSVQREVEGSFTSIFLWGKSTGGPKKQFPNFRPHSSGVVLLTVCSSPPALFFDELVSCEASSRLYLSKHGGTPFATPTSSFDSPLQTKNT